MSRLKFIERKERLRFTITGKLIILFFIILIFTLIFRNISSFLSVNDPINTKLLVVEGWLPDKVLESVMAEFYEKNYDKLIITGKPTERGYYISEYKTSADIAQQTLIALGFDKNKIEKIAIPRTITKDRTYANAVSLFYYLKKTKSKYTSFNIYTLGCHSRRSKILFQNAFPEKFNIGIISGKDVSYDDKKWWNSSRGFRTVTGEALAYLYVKLFFSPDNETKLNQIIDGYYIDKINEHRRSIFLEFKNPNTSPIILKQIEKFTGLNYFDINPDYKIKGVFSIDTSTSIFKMKTSTERLPEYRKYGSIEFNIDTNHLSLNVYQNINLTKNPEFKDYLFIPFRDYTCGEESYGGGRYLDFRIPQTDTVIIDFNLAYNPYCAYNNKYSCPIPPDENKLGIRIMAGEIKFDQ
ncbi:MAG: DUF1684 domain-containing protein [Bacteroidales bacterium]|nr:DUF1684 domain-containing protein [Bacteroidales bacterium]